MGARILVLLLAALAVTPAAVAAGNAWGYALEAVVFSRVGAGVGPSAGLNPGEAGDATGADTRYVLPAATHVNVRAFVRDPVGDPVPGVRVTGTLAQRVGAQPLVFHETGTDGAVAYDAQRVAYAGGDVVADVLFDFDADGATDAKLRVTYRGLR